jgi:chromosome segregation ATPase
MNIQEALEAIDNEVKELSETIAQKQAELDVVNRNISEARDKHQQILADSAVAHQAQEEEKQRLEAEIGPIRKENERIKQENADLVNRKSQLMQDNAKLEKRHQEIIDYEKRAKKILQAKDEELVIRERNLAEREQFSPLTSSYLPPVET